MNTIPRTTRDALVTTASALLIPLGIQQNTIDGALSALFDKLDGKATTQKKDTKDETRLVSFSGAARLMSLSRSTVYELVRQGRLDAVELSGTRKITMKSISEFLNGDRPANAKTAEAVKKSAAKYAATKRRKAA